MKSQRVVFTGAALARLYVSCAESIESFDGLLFGCRSSLAKNVYDDAQDGVAHEETVFTVTNVMTSISLCSFYDGSGKINFSELASLTECCRDPLIGWCSFHVQPTPEPSLVHKRVTHALSQGLGQTSTELFCLLSLTKEHRDATATLQYKAYLSSDDGDGDGSASDVLSGRSMIPVAVEVLNLRTGRGERHYQSIQPSSFNFLAMSLDETEGMRAVSEAEAMPLEPHKKMISELQKQCKALFQAYERNVAHVRNLAQQRQKRLAELARLKGLTRL